MNKRGWKAALAYMLILCMLTVTGCGALKHISAPNTASEKQLQGYDAGSEDASDPGSAGQAGNTEPVTVQISSDKIYEGRPFLIRALAEGNDAGVTPCVEPYRLDPDLGNLYNRDQFYLSEDQISMLCRNGFMVMSGGGSEFFEIYEQNRYSKIPSFVTVDSLMHTYHLYFSYLLKNIEKGYLTDSLAALSEKMLANSLSQYDVLKGSEWESAARRNTAFFAVGASLLNENISVPQQVLEIVNYELDNIGSADSIDQSMVTGTDEDYTQYKPRGYYEGDAQLERYFRAMMWYGRIHFTQENEDLDRSALLMTKALADDPESYALWESIYVVTSFFAGASDDLVVNEYASVIPQVYDIHFTVSDMIGDKAAFDRFHSLTATLRPPQINSIPIEDGESNVIPGLRFMGQRFTVDAAIMQELIYSRVKEDSSGNRRMLPDVLDVPAALGSDTALELLEQNGDTGFAGYTANMNKFRQFFAAENPSLWSASLYAGWLNTLRPLLDVKGEGYPMFMQNKEWLKKDLECFAGSFTELKHDTVLYSKQVMAEMGDGEIPDYDSRGYIEPEPLVYKRFADLADQTAQGLKGYGMLSEADEKNLGRLLQTAKRLQTISEKELRDERLTDLEYDFIEAYGGNLEHFWVEAIKGGAPDDSPIHVQEYPAALVVDIATDPSSGAVLEAATDNPDTILVVIKVDGRIKLAKGSVYSFYQFPWPMSDRLTDSAWRFMMGLQANEYGEYNFENTMEKPEWTETYRYHYVW